MVDEKTKAKKTTVKRYKAASAISLIALSRRVAKLEQQMESIRRALT